MKISLSLLPVVIASGSLLTLAPLASANDAIALSSGNWNQSARWTAGIGQPGQVEQDIVFIRSNYSVTVDTNVNQPFGISSILMGASTATQTATLTIQSGGVLTATSTEVVRAGNVDNLTSTLNISGGTFNTGSLLLAGNANNDNTSGTVNLSSGALNVTGATNIGGTASGKTTAFFNIAGSTATASGGSLMVNQFGTVKFTLDAVGITTLNYTGAATFATNSTFTVDGTGYTGGSATFTLINAASLTGSLATINDSIIGFNPGNYTTNLVFDNANGDVLLQVTSLVPEPSTYALLGLGLGAVLLRLRRRR